MRREGGRGRRRRRAGGGRGGGKEGRGRRRGGGGGGGGGGVGGGGRRRGGGGGGKEREDRDKQRGAQQESNLVHKISTSYNMPHCQVTMVTHLHSNSIAIMSTPSPSMVSPSSLIPVPVFRATRSLISCRAWVGSGESKHRT